MSVLSSPPIIKDKILANIAAAIREIHRVYLVDDDDEQQPPQRITNDNWQVHCLLEHLDFALIYGLKFVQDGYYKCVSEFTPKQLTNQIESLYNIESDIGRGRAWIFFALNDNLTESYMKCFQDNKKLVKKYYTADSLVGDAQRLITLNTLCAGLENIQFHLAADCTYFDRGCWPKYLQDDINQAERLASPGTRSDVPSFTTYTTRYAVQHIPSLPSLVNNTTIATKRVRVQKRTTGRTSRTSSVVNSVISSDTQPVTVSRSSSMSLDNPSAGGSSLNEDTQLSIGIPIITDSPVPTALSSSLSELDPMLNNRPRTPSPMPSPIVDEPIMTTATDEQVSTSLDEEKPLVTETIENEPPLIENLSSAWTEDSVNTSEKDEASINTSEKNELSLSISLSNGINDLSIEKKNDDLFQLTEEDPLDIPADANLQLQCTLEIYEMPNDEQMIKLFPTTLSHNNGNPEAIFLLVTTLSVYLIRQINEMNGSHRLDKLESIRLEQIDYIEIGPNEQFFRIITLKHTKLRCLTTGCIELTRAICSSISKAAKLRRVNDPQILPATMQEISIKKMLANDMKKSSVQEVNFLDYHYAFWEEPQMSGRKLRKEGYLYCKLVEQSTGIKRLSQATMKSQRHGFESWQNAYVTLRVDRLNIHLHKSDMSPALSYTLLDENCQGCRRNRGADRENVLEIMFANDITLMMSAKSKTEQDEWLNAIMKGLSQGRMATKDEESTANTVPCSVMLTDEKIYVCHDEQDNALIRQLDSIKLEYVARILVDPHYQYYCVISIEHGIQGSKSWIFYFLFAKEMVQFAKTLQKALSETYQVPIDINPLDDVSFQRDCERTSKSLLRTYRPSTATP